MPIRVMGDRRPSRPRSLPPCHPLHFVSPFHGARPSIVGAWGGVAGNAHRRPPVLHLQPFCCCFGCLHPPSINAFHHDSCHSVARCCVCCIAARRAAQSRGMPLPWPWRCAWQVCNRYFTSFLRACRRHHGGCAGGCAPSTQLRGPRPYFWRLRSRARALALMPAALVSVVRPRPDGRQVPRLRTPRLPRQHACLLLLPSLASDAFRLSRV